MAAREAALGVKGVKTAEADMNAHKVSVMFDDTAVKLEDVKSALKKAGFETTGEKKE